MTLIGLKKLCDADTKLLILLPNVQPYDMTFYFWQFQSQVTSGAISCQKVVLIGTS